MKMLAKVMIAYAIGLLVGEAVRDGLYGPPLPPDKGCRAGPSLISRSWGRSCLPGSSPGIAPTSS